MTFIQYLILFSLVYLYVYALIGRICKCIEHCATARAYSKLRENGVMTKMSDVEAGIIKIGKEKEDARKMWSHKLVKIKSTPFCLFF